MEPSSSLPHSQEPATKLETLWNILWHLTFLRWGVVITSPNPQAGRPNLVGCMRLLIQYIRSKSPYLEAVPPHATRGRFMLSWRGPRPIVPHVFWKRLAHWVRSLCLPGSENRAQAHAASSWAIRISAQTQHGTPVGPSPSCWKRLTGTVFLDAAKAFGIVFVDSLLSKITILNCPSYLRETISFNLHSRRFDTCFQSATTTCRHMLAWVAHGGIVSAVLFSLCVWATCPFHPLKSSWFSTMLRWPSYHVAKSFTGCKWATLGSSLRKPSHQILPFLHPPHQKDTFPF
jgi:hypothetical protein